jgi:hypothetical protein
MAKTRDDILKKMLQTKPKPKPSGKGRKSPTPKKVRQKIK